MNLGLLDAAALAPLLARWTHTGASPDADLRAWEQDRLSSARRAAALASLNTRLGRRASPPVQFARKQLVRTMLGPGSGRLFAHAYAMGFDAHS
ncbi:hypothetical protein [Nesterenkonia pannonica]|uniref:hypothetical protein n=1 Tax=Nesterenkonia pannonica TaxID=1548602 RepID=UPI0021644015|nr:hypothetical protein [Nesterenkonia pannonica]